jgi:general secretion pathway protein I
MTRARGFTLLEVLVALVIVAFGMGAVMAALSSSADNIIALRDRTMAEWVAMNQIADARLALTAPQTGFSEGDVRSFGGSDWHWRRDVVAVDMVPGLLEIAVRVRRLPPGTLAGSASGVTAPAPKKSASASSSGAPSSFFNSSGSSGSSSSSFGSSGSFASSGGLSSMGLGRLSSSGASSGGNIGAAKLPDAGNQQWTATVIGFRGDAIASANGEEPDWSCSGGSTGASACGASSGSSTSSGGATTVPTSSSSGSTLTTGSSGGSS